jgi:formate-dependent nitrite reductase membrane component NrfD
MSRERTMVPRARFEARDSYYGRPVLKQPVWKPQVPWYLFAGGLAGAAAAQALAAHLAGNRLLERRSWLIALAAVTASPPLLVTDLGRPERFLHMLRVVKPTSPMSIGSWILAAMGTATGAAAASDVSGLFPRAGAAAKVPAGLLGLPLATYPGVLLANTAVPVWHEARRELPFAFAGGAAAAAAGASLIATPMPAARPARRLAVMGAALEGAAMLTMERRLGPLAATYRTGEAGRIARLAQVLTAAGGAVVAAAGGRRGGAAAGGALLMAGSAATRWAVFKGGFASAADPRQTVEPQRRRARRAATPA